MNCEIVEFLKGADIQERLAGFGLATSSTGTLELTGEFIAREQEKWRALAQELDIQPQSGAFAYLACRPELATMARYFS